MRSFICMIQRCILRSLDIVVLLETHQDFEPVGLLPDFDHYGIPGPEAGLRGYGISVFVRSSIAGQVSVRSLQRDLDALILRFPGAVFGVGDPVFLAACYLPPVGSVRLRSRAAADRFEALAELVGSCVGDGEVLICGDFNAILAQSVDSASGLRGVRGHGCAFVDLCGLHGLHVPVVSPNGVVLEPTLLPRSHTTPSRPDHLAWTPGLSATVSFQGVDKSRFDSDHEPLVADICSSHSGMQQMDGGQPPLQPFSRLVWDAERCSDYMDIIGQSAADFQPFLSALNGGDMSSAAQKLLGCLKNAAVNSGMTVRCPRVSRRTGLRVQPCCQPWLDQECQALKSAVQQARASRASREELRPLRRAFNRAARRKKRAYFRQQLATLLEDLKHRPKRYWDAFLSGPRRLPPPLRHPECWVAPMRLALNPPCTEPTGDNLMAGSPPPGDGAALLGPITREEVLAALSGMDNYRATGASGCPTELLKYAVIEPQDGQSVPPELDIPQHLATMMTACFEAGDVPAAWNRLLVSPVYKRGDSSECGNYRPIAVGDALAKLYAVLLNNCLLPWLELHELRALVQAEFRPVLGTSHPLFGLRYSAEHAKAC